MCTADRPTYREYDLAAKSLERADAALARAAGTYGYSAADLRGGVIDTEDIVGLGTVVRRYRRAERRFGLASVADTRAVREHCRPERLGEPNFYRGCAGLYVTEADL